MIFNNNWIKAEVTNFTEKLKKGKTKYYLTTKIIPKNQISRNKVKYNWDTVERTISQIEGIPLNHNHKYSEANDLPRGKWIKGWVESDGAYGLAEVFDTAYNKDYIEWLKAAKKTVTVSLNVSGDSEVRQSDEGAYQEAYIKSWREISTVNVPGFLDAKSSLEIILCESLKMEGIEDAEVPAEDLNPAIEEEGEQLDIDYDLEELKLGIIKELQYTNDPYEAKKIAKDNLDENDKCYTDLKTEDEENKKNNLYLVKDKLDVIANRRYGQQYDTLRSKEQNKVLFSTDIEKGIGDELSKDIKNHYITKAVEENIDKIINSATSKESFFEKLNNVKFFENLNNIRGIWNIMEAEKFIEQYQNDLKESKSFNSKIAILVEALTTEIKLLKEKVYSEASEPAPKADKDEEEKKTLKEATSEEPSKKDDEEEEETLKESTSEEPAPKADDKEEESIEESVKKDEDDEENKKESKKDDSEKEDSEKDESKKDEVKKDESKKDKSGKDESKKDDEEKKKQSGKKESLDTEEEIIDNKEKDTKEPKAPETKQESINFELDTNKNTTGKQKNFEEALQSFIGCSVKIE